MFPKALCAVALLAAPAALVAQPPLLHTHENVSVPGKTAPLMRPIARAPSRVAFCHPETSKALGCLAHARLRAEAQAQAVSAPRPDQLTER